MAVLLVCRVFLREQLPAHRIEAGLLVVAQRIVETGKRRLHRLDALQHGPQALADRREPRRRRRWHIGRTRGLDHVGGLRSGRLQGLQLGALRIVGPHHAIDLIGWPRRQPRYLPRVTSLRLGLFCNFAIRMWFLPPVNSYTSA